MHKVRNARDRQPLLHAARAHQGACDQKEHILPFAACEPLHHIPCHNAARAAASRDARMHILIRIIINEETAVVIYAAQIIAVNTHDIEHDRMPLPAKITR